MSQNNVAGTQTKLYLSEVTIRHLIYILNILQLGLGLRRVRGVGLHVIR